MLGIPLHPLVVHFPIVLSVLLPISVLVAIRAIRKGTTPRRAWSLPLALAAALTLSAYVATQTGEAEEDRVEQVVAESAIHRHEEAGERFLVLSGVLLLVAAVGLAPSTLGRAARIVTAGGALGLVAAGALAGHSGGTLVYRDGAASAYAGPAAARDAGGNGHGGGGRDADDGDR
jgi:uncharacterized membrane protein